MILIIALQKQIIALDFTLFHLYLLRYNINSVKVIPEEYEKAIDDSCIGKYPFLGKFM